MLNFSESDVEQVYAKELGLRGSGVEVQKEAETKVAKECHSPNFDWQKNNDLCSHCVVYKLDSTEIKVW